ncbi:MAG TPA: hypothetical protein VHS29_03765 [Candidatus Acidoferrales bacterium]|nr:hypothetical protein [Candidatus Acidoferrales bacterium]
MAHHPCFAHAAAPRSTPKTGSTVSVRAIRAEKIPPPQAHAYPRRKTFQDASEGMGWPTAATDILLL